MMIDKQPMLVLVFGIDIIIYIIACEKGGGCKSALPYNMLIMFGGW